MTENAKVTLKEIREYFGMEPGEFRVQWTKLSEQDRQDLKTGIGNGTYTY